MGRVISDLPSFSETVANGDLLVCHNVSKAVNTRDEKLTVEKLLTDGLGNLGVTIASGVNVGIRTDNPAYPLHITNTAGLYVLNVQSDSDSARPGIRMEARKPSDGSIAFALFDALIGKSTGSLIYAGRVGVYGTIADISAGRYLFLSGSPDAAYDNATLKIDANDRVGIGLSGITRPGAKLEVEQSSATANIPTLRLEQADVSEEFIRFDSTVGAGNAIDTAALGSYYGKIRVNVNGVDKFIALYNT